MNANQIPYDQLDWLQIAIYFVALPIVALAGALLGLMGRIRRGGLLWSANVGMLAGAVTCLVCGLAIRTLNQKLPPEFIDYFTSDYRWRMLAATLGATCAGAWVAAIAWRFLHQPSENQAFSFSLRQVLLLQFLAFLGLGCWISLRLFVLEATDPQVLAERQLSKLRSRWEAKEWTVDPSNGSLSIDLSGLTPEAAKRALAMLTAEEVKQLPPLQSLSISGIVDSELDLAPFFQNGKVRRVSLGFKKFNQKNIEQLGKSKVEGIQLTGDLSSADLSPLSENPSLRTMSLSGKLSRKALSSLSKSNSLKELTFWNVQFSGKENQKIEWPPQLEYLQLSGPLSHRDFAALANHPQLKTLYAYNHRLNDDDVSALATLPNLMKADLWTGSLSDRGYESLANLPLNNTDNGYLQLQVHTPPFDEAIAQKLKKIRNLKSLRLHWADVNDEAMEELAELEQLEGLYISRPALTTEGFWKAVKMPRLKTFFFPNELNQGTIRKDFEAKRIQLDLQPVDLQSIPPVGAWDYTEPPE